uniref:pleckstrin homology domain-containing family A member 1 isoform X1 n=1 Tax=Ciona intestinalis TaxID=7719 RepID=UPI0002B8D726|nr:pleckstrin homology domain-containing family A member 1 isoform X1 [Ciona intestinalis]|eukprot:XP_026693782.1 pleckstrin homology domain-containing family A member 1 isoform X1 [Ciona intestinalis]
MPEVDGQNRHCGYLDIDEMDTKKKFQHRYLIVDRKKGLIQWFIDKPMKASDEDKPCGIINIGYITKVDVASKAKVSYCFVINTPFRPYYVQTINQVELEEWVEIINDASKITVPPEAIRTPGPLPPAPGIIPWRDPTGSQTSLDASIDPEQTFTYRTEIVGGVVVKKKCTLDGQVVKQDEPTSPTSLTHPDQHFQFPNVGSKIIKQGWAIKQGHVRKNWKRRYFILKQDRFAYYKSDQDKEPIRSIPINEILAARAEDEMKPRDNLLLLATTDKIYYIQAETEDDMYEWVDAFCNAININRVQSQKKKGSRMSKKLSIIVDPRTLPYPTLASPLSQSTSNLIPIVPTLHHPTSQVIDHDNFVLGRSDSTIDTQYLGESEHSVASIPPYSSSQESINSKSTESVHKLVIADKVENKPKKTHRRAESEVTYLPTHTVESATSRIHTGKKYKPGLSLDDEDILPRPEVRFKGHGDGNVMSMESQNHPMLKKSLSGSSSKSANYVVNNLDPIVDVRAAVKPSTVKKKKNPGILFSLNTMLTRKADKMNKNSKKNS